MDRMEWRETVSVDGVSVDIVVTGSDRFEWELCIENEHQVSTHWDELFDTAQAALEAGRNAIETEGMQTFAGIGDFEYLRDTPEQQRISAAIEYFLNKKRKG